MNAVDTNILARLILQDDEAQAQAAEAVMQEPVWISLTVLLELGWVLDKKLRLDRSAISAALQSILMIDTVHTPDRDGIVWAIERYLAGADWADMIHIVAARGVADRLVTLDRSMERRVGNDAPVRIETLSV